MLDGHDGMNSTYHIRIRPVDHLALDANALIESVFQRKLLRAFRVHDGRAGQYTTNHERCRGEKAHAHTFFRVSPHWGKYMARAIS